MPNIYVFKFLILPLFLLLFFYCYLLLSEQVSPVNEKLSLNGITCLIKVKVAMFSIGLRISEMEWRLVKHSEMSFQSTKKDC